MAPPRKTRRLPQRPAPTAPRRWRRRLLIAAPILLVLYALGGFFGVPWALQRWAVPAANAQLNGSLSVKTFRCNPFALSLTVEGAQVQDPAGARVLGVERFYANLQASSLIRRGLVLASLEIDRPFVQAELLADGQLNLAGLAKPGPADPAEAEAPPEPPTADTTPPPWPRVRVGHVAVTDAQAVFIDHLFAATPFRLDVSPLTFEIPRLDTRADHKNPHRLHAVAGNGAAFTWEGTVFMNPLTSDGRLTVTGLDLAQFQPYVGRYSALHLSEGTLELDVAYGLAPAEATPRAGVKLNAFTIEGLRVEQDAAPLIEGLSLAVHGLSVDAAARTVRLEQATTAGATLHLVREADGGLALARAVDTDPPAPASPPPPAPTPAPAPTPTPPHAAAESPPAPAPWTPIINGIHRVIEDLPLDWDVAVQSVAVERYAVRLADASTPTPAHVRVRDIALTAGPVLSSAGYTVPFTFSLTQETPDGASFDPGPGTVEASGRVGLRDLTAEIETAITGLDLTPASPYLTQAMPEASLPAGRIALRGKATVDAGAEPGPDTPGGLRSATFDGAFDLEALRIDGPLDEAPLLGYDRLAIRGIALDHRAGTLDIATIQGAGLRGAVAFELGGEAADAETESESEPETEAAPDGYQPLTVRLPYRVRIGELKQTTMDALVRVRGIEPPLNFVSADGQLTVNDLDLGPDATTPATLSFETGLLDTGRFTLDGTIDPDLADLNNSQANLNYQLTRLPLSPFSGFAARFVGRQLTSGDLSLSNAVSVGDFKFDTVVPITIENFKLGEKVNSPDAVKLPLDLAVAILKDGKGNIKPPDVPLAGPLNDPQVSVGKLIWYAVGNLIKSVVAAPFNVIDGALAGGGGGDGGGTGGGGPAVRFAPGEAQLPPSAAAQVSTLAGALSERPALGLRLVAVPAPDGADERALRRAALRRQIAIQDGGAPPNDARYAQAVAAWYAQTHPHPQAQATGAAPRDGAATPRRRNQGSRRGGASRRSKPAPRGSASAAGPATAAEMEAWALSQTNLDPAAVTALTAQRLEAVRAALIAAGLDGARLAAQPEEAAAPDADGVPGPAVRFEAAVP